MYLVLKCKKCGHKLYVENSIYQSFFQKMIGVLNQECPNCGEEAYENWLLSRVAEED